MLALYVWLTNLLKKEEGQDLVEYALIIAFVSIVIIAALITFRGSIVEVFTDIGNALRNPS